MPRVILGEYWAVFIGVAIWAASVQPPGEGGELSRFLRPDGLLREPIEFKDAQEGFAGVSGRIVTIEPTGKWRAARFLNDQVQEPDLLGQLTPQELSAVAGLFAAERFLESPAQLGRDVKVNRHLVSLRFGVKNSTLLLNPGEDPTPESAPAPSDPQAGPWRRFVAIVHGLKSYVK